MNRLLGRIRGQRIGTFSLQTRVSLCRPHADFRSHGEREGSRFFRGISTSAAALGNSRYSLEEARIAAVVARRASALRALPDCALLYLLEAVLQALQYWLGFGLRSDLLEVKLLQLGIVARCFRRGNPRLGRSKV